MKSTLYVSRALTNADTFIAWAKSQGFKTVLQPDDLHVTVAFSREPLRWPKPNPDSLVVMSGGERRVVRLGDGDAVALEFDSQALAERWGEFLDAGASWDWPGYRPHVTISWDAPDVDLDKVEPYQGSLWFGPERFAKVQEGWADTTTEKRKMTTNASRADVLAYLEKNAPEIADLVRKDLTAADVHSTTALGNDDEKKTPFRRMLDKTKITAKDDPAPSVGKKDDDGQVDYTGTFKLAKTDLDRQQVFGWASITHMDGEIVVDKQDDVIESAELEKAAQDFVLYSRQQGHMHVRKGVGRLIESVVFTEEKMAKCGLFAFDVESGAQIFGWWTGFQVDDGPMWKSIRAGDLPEFSIGGRANRLDI